MMSSGKHDDDDHPSAGSMRFQSDKRQFGGFLMLLGFCAMIQPLYNIAIAIGTDSSTVRHHTPFGVLFGGLWLFTSGIFTVFLGYHETAYGWGQRKILTSSLILFTQVSYIYYISGMVATGQGIRNMGQGLFLPAAYSPTLTDTRYMSAMGIMGIMAYGISLLGGITFFQLALLAYQSRKPHKQCAKHYKGALGLFSFLLFLGGLSQFLLGCYLAARFGRLNSGPAITAFYVVSRPGIAIVVGTLQLIGGVGGLVHAYGIGYWWGDEYNSFQYYIGFSWFTQVVLQALAQPAYQPGAIAAGNAPTVMAFTVALNLMPAFLHYKSRTVPDEITEAYYGLGSSHGDTEGAGLHEHDEPSEHDDDPIVTSTSPSGMGSRPIGSGTHPMTGSSGVGTREIPVATGM